MRMLRGVKPTLQVLDDILPEKGTYAERPLGVVQIPIDLIVGTKNAGRSNSFSGNFMPILREGTFSHISSYYKFRNPPPTTLYQQRASRPLCSR